MYSTVQSPSWAQFKVLQTVPLPEKLPAKGLQDVGEVRLHKAATVHLDGPEYPRLAVRDKPAQISKEAPRPVQQHTMPPAAGGNYGGMCRCV